MSRATNGRFDSTSLSAKAYKGVVYPGDNNQDSRGSRDLKLPSLSIPEQPSNTKARNVTPNPFQREIDVSSELARQGGLLALKYRNGDLAVEMKPGDEPVTVADKASSALIVKGLAEAFPNDVIISEENADDLRRLKAERVWYVDPIDGTKDYIRGESGFCVMIGLAIEHRPQVGVVYGPATETLYWGAPGHGAWMKPDGEQAISISVSNRNDTKNIKLIASKSHRNATIDKVKTALAIQDEQNMGSIGLKLATIAVGERDLYVNPTSRCSSWDTCGPEAILVAAGGRMSDIHGELLRYDADKTHHPKGLLASNSHLHDHAVQKVSPLFPSLDSL